MNASKSHGRIYTPDYLVKLILDYAGYDTPGNILGKHIMDNSCGDGAFLTEIVKRYCEAFSGRSDHGTEKLKRELETHIHGIELDETEWQKCRNNLDRLAAAFGVDHVEWDVICADTLTVRQFDRRMDYIVGNPPYVRVHNLDQSYEAVKRFEFSQGGMTDLYVVFFEIGFRMMSPTGVMCLITPSSWLSSVAGGVLRRYIAERQCLDGVIDLAHFQPFKSTTYTLISRFSTHGDGMVEYNTFDAETRQRTVCANIPIREMLIGGSFYLADRQTLENLRKIRTGSYPQRVRVKNGFATLADSVFIGDWHFSGMMIDVLKSSTGRWYKCIFPYDNNARPISRDAMVSFRAFAGHPRCFQGENRHQRRDPRPEQHQTLARRLRERGIWRTLHALDGRFRACPEYCSLRRIRSLRRITQKLQERRILHLLGKGHRTVYQL